MKEFILALIMIVHPQVTPIPKAVWFWGTCSSATAGDEIEMRGDRFGFFHCTHRYRDRTVESIIGWTTMAARYNCGHPGAMC